MSESTTTRHHSDDSYFTEPKIVSVAVNDMTPLIKDCYKFRRSLLAHDLRIGKVDGASRTGRADPETYPLPRNQGELL